VYLKLDKDNIAREKLELHRNHRGDYTEEIKAHDLIHVIHEREMQKKQRENLHKLSAKDSDK
jgi:hypothetical protein